MRWMRRPARKYEEVEKSLFAFSLRLHLFDRFTTRLIRHALRDTFPRRGRLQYRGFLGLRMCGASVVKAREKRGWRVPRPKPPPLPHSATSRPVSF